MKREAAASALSIAASAIEEESKLRRDTIIGADDIAFAVRHIACTGIAF
jgi:hypothetical protein